MIRRLIFIAIFFVGGVSSFAQQKYLRFVEKKKYEKLQEEVTESLTENSRDFDANIGATLLYYKDDSPAFDMKKAFFYNEFAKELFQEILDPKRLGKLNDLQINLGYFDVLQDSIYYKSYNQLLANPTVLGCNDYLDYYTALPKAYKNDIIRLRNKLAFDEAIMTNSVESFQDFIDSYPQASQIQDAIKRRDLIAFGLVKNSKDIELIQGFITKYPNSELRFGAMEIRDRWAFDHAVELNSVTGFQDFLTKYPKSGLIAQVIDLRDKLAFDHVLAGNTVAGFQDFLTNYPMSKLANQVIDLRDNRAFETTSDDILGWKNYVTNFPSSKRLNEAQTKLYALAWDMAKRKNTLESYELFKSEYPNSLFVSLANEAVTKLKYDKLIKTFSQPEAIEFLSSNLASTMTFAVVDTLIKRAFQARDISLLDEPMEQTTGEIQNRLLAANYYWMTLDGELITLNKYFEEVTESEESDDSDEDLEQEDSTTSENEQEEIQSFIPPKEKDYELARMGDALNLNGGFQPYMLGQYEAYLQAAKGKERSFVAIQKMIKDDLNQKKWSIAIAKIDKYKQLILSEGNYLDSLSPTITKLKDLKDILAKPFDVSIVPNNWGEPVNSLKGGEYFPNLTADDKTIYFVGANRINSLSGGGREDIFVSKKIGNKWTSPRVMSELSNASSNEAVEHVSSDATKLILFINGSIVTSTKKVGGWESPEVIVGSINSGDWQADATITSDNKAILFASSRPTNYNFALNNIGISNQRNLSYHGESGESVDIYVSLIDSNGVWGDAINLGPTINTIFNDRTPFLHPDMKTLYFSSSGHAGLGSEDVFKSTRLSDTCWTCWSNPVNLGKEINSTSQDAGFKINTGGNLAIYSKYTPNGGYDLYSIKLPPSMRPDFVATIKGKLTDSQNTIVEAQIKWEDLELNKLIGVSNVDPETGEYFIILPMGKLYGYYVDKKGYFPIANNLDLRKYNKPISISNDIKMVSIEEMKNQGVSVIANNLFFDTNKSDLLPYSIPELERVAKIIKSTDRKIQITGHTDDVGNIPANQLLSVKRAESVMKYLVSLGCDPARISPTGFGKSMPIADNKTEAGRAANRRVEVKFITL